MVEQKTPAEIYEHHLRNWMACLYQLLVHGQVSPLNLKSLSLFVFLVRVEVPARDPRRCMDNARAKEERHGCYYSSRCSGSAGGRPR